MEPGAVVISSSPGAYDRGPVSILSDLVVQLDRRSLGELSHWIPRSRCHRGQLVELNEDREQRIERDVVVADLAAEPLEADLDALAAGSTSPSVKASSVAPGGAVTVVER